MASLLLSQFADTASALIHSLMDEHASGGRAEMQPPYNDLTQFVLEQHARMPDYLNRAMIAATIGFDLSSVPFSGSRFHCLSLDQRRAQVNAWRNSTIGAKRDLIRYYESLALLALYSRGVKPPAVSATPDLHAEQVIQSPPQELKYECVVVGSGPGGAITACHLAEAGRNVLLIEEGKYLSLDSCKPFSRDEMVQKYRHGGQTVAMGANKVAYVEGRCVGGGSEINSGLYHRTPAEILEKWRKEFAVEALSESDLLPHFESCERDVSVSLLSGPAPQASIKLHEGATRLGWKSLEVPRWFRDDPQTGQGRRQSMTETFIPRFLKAGGKLLPRTQTARIRQDGSRWMLQANHRESGDLRISAEHLFICGGAVQTPALLRRSGIYKNIGDSLRLHPTVKLVAQFREAVNSTTMGVPVHQVKEFSPRISLGCSISNPPYLAVGLADHPDPTRDLTDLWPNLANYYAMITSEGHGTVRMLPGFRAPLVRYHLTENDRRNLGDGLRKLSQAVLESGAIALHPSITGSPRITCLDELSQIPAVLPAGLTSLMTIHLFSSCPMGEDQSRCAADSFGRVHGFSNLHISDASLLCSAPGVNPQGSIMAIARRNVLHFLNKLSS